MVNGALSEISIHAPRTGSDSKRVVFPAYPFKFQSTLPARGATAGFTGGKKERLYFNPRSPHGERLIGLKVRCQREIFQSTLPARGATAQHGVAQADFLISIHAPRTGSDAMSKHIPRSRRDFNPRSPHGERRRGIETRIRAKQFQSTLPARGATAQSNNSVDQNHRLCTKSIPQNSPFEN